MISTFRKKAFFSLIVLSFLFVAVFSLPAAERPVPKPWPSDWDGCTSIQVGRLATVDGSVITCHTCDGPYRTWLNIVPHQKWPDKAMNKIYSGKIHTETPADLQGVLQTGEVPQVPETYQFLNTAYPCLNEHGLAIGETTIGGRQELVNNEGMFMIEEVERLMLERAKTAREAIRLAGDLVKQYGYGDSGECITSRRRQGGLAFRDLRGRPPSEGRCLGCRTDPRRPRRHLGEYPAHLGDRSQGPRPLHGFG